MHCLVYCTPMNHASPLVLAYMSTIYTNTIKSVSTAEFNELSSEIYGKRIPHSEPKILAIIQLGVICTHMVDFCRPGHIYAYTQTKTFTPTCICTQTHTHKYN